MSAESFLIFFSGSTGEMLFFLEIICCGVVCFHVVFEHLGWNDNISSSYLVFLSYFFLDFFFFCQISTLAFYVFFSFFLLFVFLLPILCS